MPRSGIRRIGLLKRWGAPALAGLLAGGSAPALAQSGSGARDQEARDRVRELQQRAAQAGDAAGEGDEAQPGDGDGGADGEDGDRAPAAPEVEEGLIQFGAFAEGVELKRLVEYAAEELELNVSIDPALSGEVMFNAAFEVRREALLPLINSLLEQNGYMLTRDRQGFYAVLPRENVPAGGGDEGALTTSRVIRTPNMRPSALAGAIASRLGLQGAQPAQHQQQGIEYLDELGLILVTDTPERCAAVAEIVSQMIAQRKDMKFATLALDHLSAPVARERAVRLLGRYSDGDLGDGRRRQQQQQQQDQGGRLGFGLENLTERLSVAPQGNALFFRGRPDEIAEVREIVGLIDRPNSLEPKRYFTGSRTQDIAEVAAQHGLGYVTTMQPRERGRGRDAQRAGREEGEDQREVRMGGPALIVDPERGTVVYYATSAQHSQFENIVQEFEPEDETIVIREYPLEHSGSDDVAELLRALLLDEVQTEEDGLLPQNQGGGQAGQQQQAQQQFEGRQQNLLPGEAAFTGDPSLVNITSDTANNQLLIRAPKQQQEEIGRILEKIDVRRPQVFIDVKIVSMTDSDDFRLAVETQLINAGGAGGVGRTNFGLSSIAEGGSITDLATVNPGLSGLTTALIFSDQLPFVLNAMQTVTDAKLVSNPTLLVDDNVEAEIVSQRQEPTTQQSQGDNSTITSFQGFEEAGTSLVVTPRISKGGYLSLDYDIELSSFEGEGSEGLPPPRSEQSVSAESVTIPGDATIVVGGINISDISTTISKVPFIGDIPLIGQAFRDTSRDVSDRVLYVFITPRILSDQNFAGHRLLSEGPRRLAEVAPDIPSLEVREIPLASQQSGGEGPRVPAPPQDVEVPDPAGRSGDGGGMYEDAPPDTERGGAEEQPEDQPEGERRGS